ncbi:unnamed protein product, partial [Bubo scandiacus]
MWVTQSRLKNACVLQAGKEPAKHSLDFTANNPFKSDSKGVQFSCCYTTGIYSPSCCEVSC